MDDETLRQFLNQMCLDGQMDEDEIEEFLDVMMDKVIPGIRQPLEQEIKELKDELDLLKHFFTWDVDNLKELKAKGQKFTDDNTSVHLNYDGIHFKKK